jgi:hypothetical protein
MKKLLICTLLFAGILKADSIGLNINSEDVELSGTLNINNAIGAYGSGIAYQISGDYLHTENDDLFKVGFGASSALSGAEGLTLSFGLEAVFSEDFVAMPLFGQAALRLPLDEPVPATSLIVRVDYAPSVLSFIDADNYLEYRFEADMEVINNIHLFGGYRNIETNYDTYDHTLNDSWYGGLKISF